MPNLPGCGHWMTNYTGERFVPLPADFDRSPGKAEATLFEAEWHVFFGEPACPRNPHPAMPYVAGRELGERIGERRKKNGVRGS